MENKKGTKIELPQLRYAIELMCAGTNPIKPEQLEAFCRYPGGPILPEQCVEALRLEIDQDEEPVKLLGGTPNGEVVCSRDKGAVYRVGGREYFAKPGMQIASLAGFIDGEPVFLTVNGAIIRKGEILYVNHRMETLHILPSGRILFTLRDQGMQRTLSELDDDEVFQLMMYSYGEAPLAGIHELKDKKLLLYTRHTLFGVAGYPGYVLLQDPSSIVTLWDKSWLLDHGKATLYKLDDALALASSGKSYRDAYSIRLGQNPYLGGYRQIGEQHAYVGQSLRHKLECWVRAGVEQPAFERVTRELFEQDGKHYYYGQIGRHLYKMELPAV